MKHLVPHQIQSLMRLLKLSVSLTVCKNSSNDAQLAKILFGYVYVKEKGR